MSTPNKIKLAALKRELAAGIDDLARGRFQTYDDGNVIQLVNNVGRNGRIRLNALRLKAVAKVQKK